MDRRVNLITRTLLLCLFLGLSTITIFTQSIEHTCQVFVLEENVKTGEEKGKDLGEFNTSFASKKTLIPLIKTFQIPGTKMFVSASVSYNRETSNPNTYDRMFLGLILGKRPFKNGLEDLSDNKLARKDVLSIAVTAFPLEPLEKGKTGNIMLIFIGKRKVGSIMLECRK